MVGVIVQLVHFIVVQLHISGKVCAPTLVYANFFSQLYILHLNFTKLVLNFFHFPVLVRYKLLSHLDPLPYGSLVTIESRLVLDRVLSVHLQLRVVSPQVLHFRLQ